MFDLIAQRKVADVVYGSRFYGRPHRSLHFHHYLANRLISTVFSLLYNQTLTDVQVCYKMFTRDVKDSLRITVNDFGIELQIGAQIALARRWRIYELGIQYYGRTYAEGKKINWKDGVKALWYLIKFRFGRRALRADCAAAQQARQMFMLRRNCSSAAFSCAYHSGLKFVGPARPDCGAGLATMRSRSVDIATLPVSKLPLRSSATRGCAGARLTRVRGLSADCPCPAIAHSGTSFCAVKPKQPPSGAARARTISPPYRAHSATPN